MGLPKLHSSEIITFNTIALKGAIRDICRAFNVDMVHLIIEGFVQGVGFRKFIEKKAEERGIYGWITNLPDGTLEAVFDSEKEKEEEMIEACRKGPFLAQVKNIKIDWNYKSPVEIVGFKIIK